MCKISNQEHRLSKELEPFNQSTMINLMNVNLFQILIKENKKIISDIGILVKSV